MFQTKVVEKFKTNILYSINVFRKSYVYGINWKNMVEPVEPHQNLIRHRHIACWIKMPTDTHTHTQTHKHTLKMCNNYCFSTPTTVTRRRLNITFIPTLPVLSQVIRLRMSGFYLHYSICLLAVQKDNNCLSLSFSQTT